LGNDGTQGGGIVGVDVEGQAGFCHLLFSG
jgi:hypothetical protein